MASDDDPYGGGRRSERGRRGAASGGGEEKERDDDRGRSRSRTRDTAPADRRRSRSRGPVAASAAAAAPAQPRAERLRWCNPAAWDTQFTRSGLADHIAESIKATFRGIGRLRGYNMDGDQSASTHVDGASFTTTDQMHSEMCAIAATPALLPSSDAYATASNPRSVRFTTDQPHCGYCTFFLAKLGLPLTAPTAGMFNLARNCGYPLPDPLISNLVFLASACGLDIAGLVAKLNEIYVNTGEAQAAAFKANTEVLKHVWRQVFAALNETLPTLR